MITIMIGIAVVILGVALLVTAILCGAVAVLWAGAKLFLLIAAVVIVFKIIKQLFKK